MPTQRDLLHRRGLAAKPLVLLSVRVPRELHQRLKVHAVKRSTPIQRLVEQALRALLKRAKE